MYKISKNKYLKIFLTIILSISITTGIMYQQKREVEAVVLTLPVVAIPIIKALIASGITFASVDAMLEAYNVFVQDTGTSTLTGALIEELNDRFIDLSNLQSVQDLLNHHFPGGQVPDPNDPEWNNYKNLTLGTIGVSLLNKWEDLMLWVGDKFVPGENDYSVHPNINEGFKYGTFKIGKEQFPATGSNAKSININQQGTRIQLNPLLSNGIGEMSIYITGSIWGGSSIGWNNLPHYTQFDIPAELKITRLNKTDVEFEYKYIKQSWGSHFTTKKQVMTLTETMLDNIGEAETIEIPYIGEEILNDPTRKHINETTEKEEVLLPLPIEIVEYDEDQQKWVLNPNKEMDLNDIKKQLEPLVDKNYQDVSKETPTPTNIPTPTPTPDPNPDPYPNPDETPVPDPSTPGNPPPGTGTPVDPSTGEPLNPDDYRIPDLLRFIFWIILLIIKLILKMIMLVINLFRIPATPDVIPREAREVILFIKNNKLPGFETSFYSIITTVGGLLLSIRFVKIFVNYFKGSSNDYEREAESIIKTKYNEMQQRNKWKMQRDKLDAKTGFSRRKP